MNAPVVVSLIHLGCARNLIDSELILARLADEGLVPSGDPEVADTVILNTCSFIGPAREESERNIEALIAKKRRGELNRVVVAGCLVQRYKQALGRRYPEVDLFAEISDGRRLARSVRALAEGERVPSYLESSGLRAPDRDRARLLATPGSYAYLRISHGCDHQCSFCAIPSIRGPHRSKRPEDLLDEARELTDAGVRELVLVAEDSTAWGRDFGTELPALVEALAGQPDAPWIRIMYAYPNRFPWDLTRLLRDHPRVAPYLDIPVQHISTPVLRAMRRMGSGDQVRRLFDRLLEEVPDITLRTTLLVGFPGETSEHADELAQFVREYRLGRVGAFTYSREEDTSAYELGEGIPEEEAVRRQKLVFEARDEMLAAGQREWIGRELDVLVDEVHGAAGAIARGAFDAPEVDLVCVVRDVECSVGDTLRVRVEGLDDDFNLECLPVSPAGVDSAAVEAAP